MWPIVFFSFLSLAVAQDDPSFTDHCHETHALGLKILIRTAVSLAEEERSLILHKYSKALDHASRVVSRRPKPKMNENNDGVDPTWNPLCPMPNATMFTTKPPTAQPSYTTVAGTGTTKALAASTTVPSGTGSTSSGTGTSTSGATGLSTAETTVGSTTGGSSSPIGTTEAPPEEEEASFRAVPLYMDHHEDPLTVHMTRLHNYVSRPKEACDNSFTDLNSITEQQLYGFLASLATTNVGPFCSICHRMVNEVRKRAFVVSALLHSEDEQILAKFLFSHVPSTKSICSALAPACYENYEDNVMNVTDGLICAECSACMTVTNILQHRLLLKPTAVQAFKDFLRSSLFHNICSELCNVLAPPQNFTIWPQGFSYDGCRNWFDKTVDGVLRFVTTITRPERFCSLELGWCELNEVPNMLQCLPEFCEEFLGGNPLIKLLCNLLPGDREAAAQFLNVAHSKRYKEKKAYHDEIRVDHDEL